MSPDLSGLAALSLESPMGLRILVGAVGGLLLIAGARVYKAGLFGSCFAAGAVGAAVGLAYSATWVDALGRPEVIGLGALVAGVAVAGVAALAHRVALLAVGGVAGIVLGAGVGDLIGGAGLVAGPAIGALVGALLFPWVFEWLLKLVTPAVGAVCIAWAVGRPDTLWLVLVLWLVGALVQVGLLRSRAKPIATETSAG